MPGRMSNRDRISKLAAEKAAERREKEEAKKSGTARKTTRRSSSPKAPAPIVGRVRLVWTVCDQRGNAVETFPYPDAEIARETAARLSEGNGKAHYVRKDKVPLE